MRGFCEMLLSLSLAATMLTSNALGQTDQFDDNRDSGSMASPYLPIESWVYPAIERLAAAGYIRSDFSGQRPWTRMECARLVEEAVDLDPGVRIKDDLLPIYTSLAREFAPELRRRAGGANSGLYLDSTYTRVTGIAGAPITDGYHFGQTLVNDYGRPYGQGVNTYSGLSLRGVHGPFSFYARGELQRAALQPPALASSSSAIAASDANTIEPEAGPVSGMLRGRLLDAYVSYTFKNNQLSFGKQSLWWGPGKGGPVLFSNNAEPVTMLRYDRTEPFTLPWIGSFFGPIRIQLFLGRLSGQQFVLLPGSANSLPASVGHTGKALGDQPFLNGQKISFKPTPNLELSASRTTIFGGTGYGFTFRRYARSLFSVATSNAADDPGDQRTAFDFTYRVPGLRDWVTFYGDAFSDDEIFPMAYPKECVWNPGLFFPKLPHLPKMDLRVEGFLSPPRYIVAGYYYSNFHYQSGYTNNRQLIGSWIGRQGRGEQIWTTWWFSPRTSIQASYRNMTADRIFLGGGNLHDFSITSDIGLRPEWTLHVVSQYERWSFPLYVTGPRSNLGVTAQLTFTPVKKLRDWLH